MKALNKTRQILGALGLVLAMSQASHAQVNSNNATVNLNAVLGESLTVAAAPGTVNFALVPSGSVNGSSPIAVTTSWALAKTRTSVKLYGYFGSTTALTDGAGDNIPVANVSGNVNGGGAAPFTGATPFGGSTGMTIFAQVIGGAGTFNSNHADSIVMSINTAGLALPAATYTGVLNLQAQAL